MQTIAPDAHGIAVLLLIAVALVLFSRDGLPLESSSLVILTVLIAGFHFFPYQVDGEQLEPAQFLSGFGSEALIAICALILIGQALQTTGALQPLATLVSRTWATRPKLALLLMLLSVAVLSGFINDTPIVVLMIPILVGVAAQTKSPVSEILLPMGLATIIGGMATTIGTSTNLLVIGVAHDLGMDRIGMFEFLLPAAIVGSIGLLYVWLVVPKLLPKRTLPARDSSPRTFEAQLLVAEGSFAAGKELSDVFAKAGGELRIDKIRRDNVFVAKLPTLKLQPGDFLYIRDIPEKLKHFEHLLGTHMRPLSAQTTDASKHELQDAKDLQLAELVVTRRSPLYAHHLANLSFGAVTGVEPVAVHRGSARRGRTSRSLESSRLEDGDILLLQGSRANLAALKARGDLLMLDGTMNLPSRHHAKRALAVLALVILTAATGILPISISALLGVGFMLTLGCLSWNDVGRSLPIPVILVIVTSLALGKAMVATQMAEYLALGFVDFAADLSKPAILSAFLLIMAVLTNIVSNNAAAVIGTPIAIATATQLNVDPMPFVLAVLFGANMSFATPFGYQTNLLIMSSGGYKFSDFLRVGIPLVIIMWLGFSIVLPQFYPLD